MQSDAPEAAVPGVLDEAPADPAMLLKLGAWLYRMGRHGEAEQALRQALSVLPDDAAIHTNLGLVLEATQRLAEAEYHQRLAASLAPEVAQIQCHLADLLSRLGQEAEAEARYEEAIRLAPDSAVAYSNLGAFYCDSNRPVESESALRMALALNPTSAAARLNLGQLLLAQGRFEDGWAELEMRQAISGIGPAPNLPADAACARWRGEPLTGRRVLVWPEQGFGDQIQFCRYLVLLKAQGPAQLTLVCHAPLLQLLKTLDGPDEVIAVDAAVEALQRHDVWTSLLSLPLWCGSTLAQLPRATPYLRADPALVDRWAPRVPGAGLRVGLVWRGNPLHDNDADRSLPGLASLAPLWSVAGVSFVSLQKLAGEGEALSPPSGQPLCHLGSDLLDFADLAAVLTGLDLLISVDTAAAHLAGALALPCWLLLPARRCDWRWLRGRDDTPWYPGMRLFRQLTRGDWRTPLQDMVQSLTHWARRDSPR